MKPFKSVIIIGLILGLFSSLISFSVFYKNIEMINTEDEWKFYSSLIGFLIFFSILTVLILILVLIPFIKRKMKKLLENEKRE